MGCRQDTTRMVSPSPWWGRVDLILYTNQVAKRLRLWVCVPWCFTILSADGNGATSGNHSRCSLGLIPGPGPGAVGLNSCTLDISTSLMDPPAGKRPVNFSLTHSISRLIHPFAISGRGRVVARFSVESKEWRARDIASHSGSNVSLGASSVF